MKKSIIALMALLALFAAVSVGAQAKPKDGFYFAEEAAFQSSGWKDQVTLEVKGGKIVTAVWNGINNKGAQDKKTESAAGRYGMVKASKIAKEWHEQAAAVEKYLVDTQDLAFSKFNASGGTDAISGASLGVKGFFELAKAAVAAGPVAKGSYKKDGWFYAKQGEWNLQAPRVEAALVKQQDPAKIAVKADGKTDAVSGVSVTINEFIAVAVEALKAAK